MPRATGSKSLNITIEGIPGLNHSLKTLMSALQDMAVMQEIARQAAQLASSYAPSKSGRLRGSIKGNKAKNKAIVKGGSKRVPYAAAINYGWPRRNIAASGFMQKADRVMRPRLPKILDDAIVRLIREGRLN